MALKRCLGKACYDTDTPEGMEEMGKLLFHTGSPEALWSRKCSGIIKNGNNVTKN